MKTITRRVGALVLSMALLAGCAVMTHTYEMNADGNVVSFSIQLAVPQDTVDQGGDSRGERILEAIAYPNRMGDEEFEALLFVVPPGDENRIFLDDLLVGYSHLETAVNRSEDTELDLGYLSIVRRFPDGAEGTLRELLPDVENVTSRVNSDGSVYVELDAQSVLPDLLNETPTTECAPTYSTYSTDPEVVCVTAPNEKTDIRDTFSVKFVLTLPYPIKATNGEIVDGTGRTSAMWGPLEQDFDLKVMFVQTDPPEVDMWRFPDVDPARWSSEAIYWAVDNELMGTRPNHQEFYPQTERFVPSGSVSKHDLLVSLFRFNRLLGGPEAPIGTSGSDSFPDITPGGEEDTATGWAIYHNIAIGELAPIDCFYYNCDPGSWMVTRVAAVGYLFRVAPLVGGHSNPDRVKGHQRFVDIPPDYHADESIGWAAANGITYGVGNNQFRPSVPTSRGEVAAFMHRLYQQVIYSRSLTGE